MIWLLLVLGCDPGVVDTAAPELPVCLNELMPDNETSLAGPDGSWPDWLELHNPGPEAVSLDGWTLTDDPEEPGKISLDGLSVEAGGFLLLFADDRPELGLDHLELGLAKEGEDVGLLDPDGLGAILRYGLVEDDFSVAREPDCCTEPGCLEFDFRGTPGASNTPPVIEEVLVLELGSTWRYHIGEEEPGWRSPGFDDSGWPRGLAPLGYGDSHQVTILSYGPDANDKHITTWFRLEVEVPELGRLEELRLELLRDDGAVIWLDGLEVARSNLPEGPVDADTLASETVGGAEETATHGFALDPELLAPGPHVLAVEVHQAASNSSDLGFDLGIVAEVVTR